MKTLSEVQSMVQSLGRKIKAPARYLELPGTRTDMGSYHLEIQGDQFHYICTERGSEYDRKVTTSLDELLYWIFKSVTFKIASEYELYHRVPNQDSRRKLFEKQLDLLGTLNSSWREKLQKKIDHILTDNPFKD